MNRKSILTVFAETVEKNKILRALLIGAAGLTALLLFAFSGSFASCGKKQAPAEEAAASAAEETRELEARLESILSSIAGVGKTKVMLMLDSTEEQIIARDSVTKTAQGGSTEESRPSTVSTGGGESRPIVLTERLPRVRGVIVAAQGAADISVRLNIIAAVSTVLGIDQSCVEVFVMGG